MSVSPSNSSHIFNSTVSAVRSRCGEVLDFDTSSSSNGHMMKLHTTMGTMQSDDSGRALVDFANFDELPVTAIMDEVGHILDHCIASEPINNQQLK